MRVVVRVYRDEHTKPHHDQYKDDCFDELDTIESSRNIYAFIENARQELEYEYTDDEDEQDSSDEARVDS